MSAWKAETVAELLEDAHRAVAETETCDCPDDPHHNTLHDLAHDLVDLLTSGGDAPLTELVETPVCVTCRGDETVPLVGAPGGQFDPCPDCVLLGVPRSE